MEINIIDRFDEKAVRFDVRNGIAKVILENVQFVQRTSFFAP